MLDEAALGPRDGSGVHRRPAALDGAVEGRRRPPRPARRDLGLRPGRADRARATLHPGLGPARRHDLARAGDARCCRRGSAVPSGALAVSLPEACRLSDALAASLRARLGLDPSEADLQARLRALRASVERVRDLVDREPAQGRARRARRCSTGSTSASLTCWPGSQRGADVGGLLGPLEQDAARAERDLIVGASTRRAHAHDEARAPGAAHRARGPRRRPARPRGRGAWPRSPRRRDWPSPTCRRSGPVPTDPAAVDAYLVRLDAVGRAMTMAQDAYASALAERDELQAHAGAYAAKAADQRTSPRRGPRRRSRGARATRRRVARPRARRPGPRPRARRRLPWPTWAAPASAPPRTTRRRRPP